MSVEVTCPHCGELLESDDEFVGQEVDCGACGERFVLRCPKRKRQIEDALAKHRVKQSSGAQRPGKESRRGGGVSIFPFFAFKTLLSTRLIKVLYVLGVLGITGAGIAMIADGAQRRDGAEWMMLTGVVVLVVGNIVWRLACEGWILLFSIHDALHSIDSKLD